MSEYPCRYDFVFQQKLKQKFIVVKISNLFKQKRGKPSFLKSSRQKVQPLSLFIL